MFSQCLRSSNHVLPVSTGFSKSLLGFPDVLPVSDGFYLCSPNVCWVLLMLFQCLLRFSLSLLDSTHVLCVLLGSLNVLPVVKCPLVQGVTSDDR